MGRKIPGKKHKGVKDPEKQRAVRLAELAPKINAPPKNVDEQAIPRSLERVMKLKAAAKNHNFVIKKKRKKKLHKGLVDLGTPSLPLHPKAKPEKVVPIFKQRPNESPESFMFRVSRETEAFIKETEFETKYNVDVKRNKETGRIEGIVNKSKDEIDELVKLKLKHKNVNKKKKKKVADADNVKLTKAQKRKQKLLEKKEKKLQNNFDEFKMFKDKVEFGDIVHAPPELKPFKKPNSEQTTRVGNKNLLLNSLLKPSQQQSNQTITTIDRSGKRKNLPVGERRQIEKQQTDAIAAYRLLKAEKTKS